MKGLPCRFVLNKGKFQLVEGPEKSKDSIWFFSIFDKFRVYTSDFGGNFVSLVQKPTAYLALNRTLIVGSLKRKMKKYIPGVNVEDIDIGYTTKDRKEYTMKISYSTRRDNGEITTDVTFI